MNKGATKVCIVGSYEMRRLAMRQLVGDDEPMSSDEITDVYRKRVGDLSFMIWDVKKMDRLIPLACRVVVFLPDKDRERHMRIFENHGCCYQKYVCDQSSLEKGNLLDIIVGMAPK